MKTETSLGVSTPERVFSARPLGDEELGEFGHQPGFGGFGGGLGFRVPSLGVLGV